MRAKHEFTVAGTRVRVQVRETTGAAEEPSLFPSLGAYPLYDASLYEVLTKDGERNERFQSALRAEAGGNVVVDIGTGSDLTWAREALAAGARQVMAIEEMPSSCERAALNLRRLGLESDIGLVCGQSTQVELPRRASVCVAEIIGSIGGAEGAAVVLADARRRHLTPDAVIIPHRCVTRAALVNLEELMAGAPPAFAPAAVGYLEQVFVWNGAPFDIRVRFKGASYQSLMSSSEVVENLDFNGELAVRQTVHTELAVLRPGAVDGLLLWPELTCHADQAPLDALDTATSWEPVYVPLFEEAMPVSPGDGLALSVRTELGDDGVHPDYRIDAVLHGRSASILSAHHGGPFRNHSLYRLLFPEQ